LVAIELMEESLVSQGKPSILGWKAHARNVYLYGTTIGDCYVAFLAHLLQLFALSGHALAL